MSKVFCLCLVFLYCLTTVYAQVTFLAPTSVSQTNYGVQFYKVGTILNGVSYHKHTIAIPIPKFTIDEIPSLPCNSAARQSLLCNHLNDIINRNNNYNAGRVVHFNTLISDSLTFVKVIGKEIQLRRRKRSTNKEEQTGNLNRRVRRETHLGVDYCQHFNGATVNHPNGILPTIGKIGSNLLGTPTFDDIENLSAVICEMAELDNVNSDEIVASNRRLNTMSKSFQDQTGALSDSIVDTLKRINIVKNTFEQTANLYDGQLNNVNAQLAMLNTSIKLNIDITFEMERMSMFVNNMNSELLQFQLAMTELTEGKVPMKFVNISTMQSILNHIDRQVLSSYGDSFKLVSRQPLYHYHIKDISYTRSDKFIYIAINIPITNTGGELSVYRVDSNAVALNDDGGATHVVGLADFFAITADNNYFMEMSVDEYVTCRGELLKICPTQRSLRTIDQMTCACSIFVDDVHQAVNLCQLEYVTGNIQPVAYQLSGNSTYFIQNINNEDVWYSSCPTTTSGTEIKTVKSCRTCQVRLPCGCSLWSAHFFITADLSSCKFDDDASSTTIITEDTTNKVAAKLFFSNDTVKSITGNGQSNVKIKFPTFDVIKSNWSGVVERQKQRGVSMQKLIKQYNTESKAYETKSDFLREKVEKLTKKLNDNVLDINKVFGDNWFSNIISPTGSGASVSISFILAGICSVFALYVMCKPAILSRT